MENQLLIALSRNKLLKNIDISKIDFKNVKGNLITISEGEILYREGDKADSIYLVISGEINILKKRLLGKTKSYIFGECDFFGYEEFFEGTSRTSTAVALRDSYLILLTREEVDFLIGQENQILLNLKEPVSEIDEEQLSKKNKIVNKIEPKEVPILEPIPDKKSLTIGETADSFNKRQSKEFFQSISDVSRADANPVQPLGKIKVSENELPSHDDFSFYETESSTPEKTSNIKPDSKEEESKLFSQKTNQYIFPGDLPLNENEIAFDESTFLNEDGIPKAEVEIPDKLPSHLRTVQSNPDDDLNDALFKILSRDEPPSFETKKEVDIQFIQELDERFIPTNKIDAEPVMDFESFTTEYIHEEDVAEPEPVLNIIPVYEEKILPPIKTSFKGYEQNVVYDDVENKIKAIEQKESLINQESQTQQIMKQDELQKIIKAAELVNSNIRIDDVLKAIVDVATELTKADRGTLYLIDKEKNELWSLIALGEERREIRLQIGTGLAGYVAKSGETLNIADVHKDPRFNADFDRSSGYKTKSMLCFPIKNNKSDIIGVLQLLNNANGEFSKRDEEFLTALSIHSAIALQNADLVEKLLQTERINSLGKMANFLIQDIKKPVLVGKRYAEHLRSKILPPDVTQIIDMLLAQLNQVADIVQTTSSYSDANTIFKMFSISLNSVIADYASRVEQYVEGRNCQIVSEYDKDVTVKLDVKEFFQCYMHIIKNACDAMPDGGKILVSTKKGDKKVEIHFRDTGLGIPEGFKDKVFDPFMSYGKKEGTGLGLAITKKIVEAHKGTIEFESTMGEGAVFIISLPIATLF
jgi:signal transduction histidine kinase